MTFVRHGETVANATGKYNSKTLNTFSSKGQKGVDALTQRLIAAPRFDRILVSPSERALRTIAPYLKATRQVATVWPSLYECCTGKPTPAVPGKGLKFGSKITIPKDIKALFTVEPGHDRLPVAPDFATGLVQVDQSVAEFRQRFNRGRLLIVGHSGHGGHFIHALTSVWHKIENTTEIVFSTDK